MPTKEVLVIRDPNNPFNDLFHVGVVGGTITGLVVGYLTMGKLLPLLKKTVSAVRTGRTQLVLMVRDDLQMRRGVVATECSSATLQMYRTLEKSTFKSHNNSKGLLTSWEWNGQPKIVLRVQDLPAMQLIANKAKKHGIPVSQATEKTGELLPLGTVTAMAVGPARPDQLEGITSHLRLL